MTTRPVVIAATALAALVAAAATAQGSGEASRAGGFGTAGVVRTSFGGDDRAEDVALQPDGKIVVAGVGRHDFALARYDADGRLDRRFGGDGKVRTNLGGRDAAAAIAIQPDGRIVAAGESKGDFAIVRYLPNGRLDRSFGRRGTVRTAFAGKAEKERFGRVSSRGYSGAKAVALQRNGRIVVAGRRAFHAVVVRYLPNGRLDRSFGRLGKIGISFGRDYSDASAVAVQRDAKIVAALNGGPPDGGGLLRFTRRGTNDRSFGRSGAAFFDVAGVGEGSDVAAVAVQEDGKIVAAGGAWFHSGPPPPGQPSAGLGLARYLPSGRFDPRFGARGKVMTDLAAAAAVAIQRDGRIVVAGAGPWVLARFTAEGRPDASFGAGGRVRTRFGGRPVPSAVAIQANGKIVVAGRSGGDFLIVGYRPDGTLDS